MLVPKHYRMLNYTNNVSQHYCKPSHNTHIVHILYSKNLAVITRTLNFEGGAAVGWYLMIWSQINQAVRFLNTVRFLIYEAVNVQDNLHFY